MSATKAAAKARQKQLEGFQRRLAEMDTVTLDAAEQAMHDAIEHYVGLATAWNDALKALSRELEETGLQAEPGVSLYSGRGKPLQIGDVTRSQAKRETPVARAALTVLRRYIPHGFISLDAPEN